MPDVDSKLVTALRQAKGAPMFYAFVAKGTSDGVLLVSKKKIAVKEINEAKAASGGKLVFRGTCTGEEGKMVFNLPKEPPGTLAKQLKTVIHRDAGMNLQVETRVVENLEEEMAEGEEQDTTASVPPPPTPPQAPSQAPPQAPPSGAPDATARFKARLAAILPVMQKVESLNSPRVKVAKDLLAQANKHFLGKQVDQALTAVDQAEGELKKALLEARGNVPQQAPQQSPQQQPQQQQQTPPQNVEQVKPVSNVVFTQSRLLWDSTRKSVQVELQAMEQKILHHCETVNADPDSEFEYDSGEVAANVKQLYTLLEKLDTQLMDKLDEALNAADPQMRKEKQRQAKDILQRYQGVVNSDPLLESMAASTIAPSNMKQSILNVLNGLASKL
jgi:hypothetical protein